MATVAPPVALTIALDFEPKPVPESLVTRLTTPPSSPTRDKNKQMQAAEKLREAHISAVKARAERDLQRARDAQERKLRLAAANAQKVERRMALATIHVANVRETEAQKREEAKQKRVALAAAVDANRKAAGELKERRAAELRQACTDAHDRRAKALDMTVEKSAAEVKHAINVVQTFKRKEKEALVVAAERLTERLEAAELRREMRITKPVSPSTAKSGVRHRVFNEANVAAGFKRRSLFAAMDKAALNRESHVQEVANRASKHCAAVQEKAAAVKNSAKDKASPAANRKNEWTERMIAAEIAWKDELKKRYDALGKADLCAVLVIVDDFSDALRSPPPKLLNRLLTKSQTLLATAHARQAGALARRQARTENRAAAIVTAKIKATAAAKRRATVQATKKAAMDIRVAVARLVLTQRDAARKLVVCRNNERFAAAAKRRAAEAAMLTEMAKMKADKCAGAYSKHTFHSRCRAKAGITAMQANAASERRTSVVANKAMRLNLLAARCISATKQRSAMLAARMRVAKAFSFTRKQKMAAVKIQSLARGKTVRTKAAANKRSIAAVAIQKQVRGLSERKKLVAMA